MKTFRDSGQVSRIRGTLDPDGLTSTTDESGSATNEPLGRPLGRRRISSAQGGRGCNPNIPAWASLVLNSHGAPDLLLNNAGVISQNAHLWEVTPRDFDRVIDVNVKGVANVIRHFIPEMLKRKRGIIVNFSSGWGRSTDAEVAPYCASKWAVEGLTLAFAQELPSGIAAISLNPGIINTGMLQTCFGAAASKFISPPDWAKVAVPFLLGLTTADNGKQLQVPLS